MLSYLHDLNFFKRKFKWKLQKDTIFLPSRWTKIKMFDHTLNWPECGKAIALKGWWEYKLTQPPWVAIQHCIKLFEARTHWPINPTALECIPQTYLHICMQSWMYKAIHCSTVYNNRRLETAWMSINKGLLKQIAIHPYNRNLYGC